MKQSTEIQSKSQAIFDHWFNTSGHWVYGVNGRVKAMEDWKTVGIEGLPDHPSKLKNSKLIKEGTILLMSRLQLALFIEAQEGVPSRLLSFASERYEYLYGQKPTLKFMECTEPESESA